MAQAVRFHETGGPEVLRLEEVAVGDPGPGEVRIRHAAVGCNFADTYFRSGYYPVQPPCGIGVEAAGTIECYVVYVDPAVGHTLPRDCCTLSTPWASESLSSATALTRRPTRTGGCCGHSS